MTFLIRFPILGSLAAPLLGHPFGTRTSFSEDTLSFASLGAARGQRFWLGLFLPTTARGEREQYGDLRSLSPDGRREACRVKDQVRATDASSAAETCEMITKPPRGCQFSRGDSGQMSKLKDARKTRRVSPGKGRRASTRTGPRSHRCCARDRWQLQTSDECLYEFSPRP